MSLVDGAILAYGLAALFVWRRMRRCPERYAASIYERGVTWQCRLPRGHRGPCWGGSR